MSSFDEYAHDHNNDHPASYTAPSAPLHNAPKAEDIGSTSARLRSYIERIERLEEEKRNMMEDIKAVMSEAKGEGFDTKILKQVIKIRAMDSGKRMEQEALLETYLSALGMI